MTRSGVCWIMLHSEFSTRVSKLCWCSAGVSWLFRALRDVSDESLLAKYLLLLLLPASQKSVDQSRWPTLKKHSLKKRVKIRSVYA